MTSPFSTLSNPSPMDYGRLKPTTTTDDPPTPQNPTRRRLLIILLALGSLLILTSSFIALAAVRSSAKKTASDRGPTTAIKKACGLTRYPDLCVASLVDFPGARSAGDPRQLAHISMNMTLRQFGRALSSSTEIGNWGMGSMARSAYDDCLELLEDSMELLDNSLVSFSPATVDGSNSKVGLNQDVMTWLSGAMTNQDTCLEGLGNVGGPIKDEMAQRLRDLSELVSNCLAIYAATHGLDDDFSGSPIQNRRRRLLDSDPVSGFPIWMSRSEREMLETPTDSIQADITVAQDGSGTVKTISEAIKKAPQRSSRRIIIHIKAGIYAEKNLKVGRKKTNLWFLGEGIGRTIITGNKSVFHDNITTFHTASFAASGAGFVARGITFTNDAGSSNHQAVALRVGADRAVVYRCEVKGHQDTLYVHSQRQFFRETQIYGTIDFIFGNAAVVFQNCTMWARKPMQLQKVTITAQNRKDPNQNTGMSMHACQIMPTPDLNSVKSNYPTYLGRPWKMYSRVVYMESYIGDHVHPKGWLEWNTTFPTDKLYYGEYGNFGPGSNTSTRVQWPGLHVNMSRVEAGKFTVAEFIFGQTWITATGVAYQAGLSD